MSIGPYCRRAACTAAPHETLRAAAQRMEKEGVGLLVVTEGERLAGVLTDRDVALHVAAEGRDAAAARIGDAMSRSPATVALGDSLEDALERMAHDRVRRLPVLDGGRVEGVVSADDLLLLLAREIAGLGDVLVAQLPAGARPLGRESPRKERPVRQAEHYLSEVATAEEQAPVAALAREMRERAVGSVVVVGRSGRAVGLVTDRDVALRVVAAGLEPATTSASDVMSTPLVSARPAEPLEEVVGRMRTSSVRRIPVLRSGRPVGIVTLDDLLVAFGHELDRLGACVAREIRRSRTLSYPAWVRRELEERLEEAAARLREVGNQTLRTVGRELDQVADRVLQAIRSGPSRAWSGELAVRDLMRVDVRTCRPGDALSEAARIMWENDCGCVPVVAGDGSRRVVGMITDRDLCMAAYTSGGRLSEMRVESAMARRVHWCHPEDPLSEAEALMRSAQVRRLPVVDERGRLRGLLSLADLATAAAGIRGPAGAVSASEVGAALEAICRPRTALERA